MMCLNRSSRRKTVLFAVRSVSVIALSKVTVVASNSEALGSVNFRVRIRSTTVLATENNRARAVTDASVTSTIVTAWVKSEPNAVLFELSTSVCEPKMM